MADEIDQPEAEPELIFQMEWDQAAREMLEMVPAEFRSQAVSGTEEYARKRGHKRVSAEVVEAYRKELGF